MRALLGTAVLFCAGMNALMAQDCVMDQYTELTVDSLVDPIMKAEVLSVYPFELVRDTSMLITIEGLSNCKDRAEFKGRGISVLIQGAPFDSSKHTFGYDKSQGQPFFLCNIDGHGFWGGDGTMPHREIKALNVTIGDKTVHVPRTAFQNLFDPNFCDDHTKAPNQRIFWSARCALSKDGHRLYLYMMNSDGAGGYLVTWIFVDERYWGRVVEHGS